MARVNVETRALAESRLRDFMKIMRWRKAQAIGTLVLLWHDSQERLVVKATKKQLISWCDAKNASEGEKIIKALVESEYLSEESDGTFHIRGNEKQVEAQITWKEAQRRGGRASGETRKNKSLAEVSLQSSEVRTEVNSIQCNAMQDNSSQSNATQDNTIQNAREAEQPDGAPPARAANAASRGPVPELQGDDVISAYLADVSKEAQRAWLKAYPGPDWIMSEIKRAHVWITANPQKKPKQFARFFANWFNRAFESYRKGIPSRRLTHSEVNAQAAMDLFERNQKGEL